MSNFTCSCGFCGSYEDFEENFADGDDLFDGRTYLVCPECGQTHWADEAFPEPEEDDGFPEEDELEDDFDEERGLRLQEEFAAYRACGCTEGFWEDLAGGYIR